MAHRIKALGLTLIAAFALSAAAASSAVAVEGVLTAGKFPASITASQVGTDQFGFRTIGLPATQCAVTTMSSTTVLSAATSSLSYKPTCTGAISSPGSAPGTISFGSCTWSLTTTTKLTASTGEASVTITGCGTGSNPSTGATYLTLTTFGTCEYEIGSQGPLSSISWINSSSDLILTWSLKVTAKVVKGFAGGCGAFSGNSVMLSYSGEETFTADSGGLATSLRVS